MAPGAEHQDITEEYTRLHGDWDPVWNTALELDPEFVRALSRFSAVPRTKGRLDPVARELVSLAVAAAATYLHVPAIRTHIREALRLGATRAQVLEVLECAATVGIHAMNIGVPILVQVLEEKGLRTGPAPLGRHQEELKARFMRDRGYWHEFWNEMLELDPEMFEAYTEFSSIPWRTGTLEPKVREFVYIAFDAASTHLYVKGLKLHIENAVEYGATADELLEVLEIASLIGVHALRVALPILDEEAGAAAG